MHRDLKPGNVWLTADGTAKIGDYGLAMSAQNTRLTLQGTMVGTVDYMPPEQALGGDITARSDLYSLGAMLYELVTGKPPFQGDRIAEVISQHINVVPPPPSERGASIPSALDALIVELLAKDPAQRPASARRSCASASRRSTRTTCRRCSTRTTGCGARAWSSSAATASWRS